jgi:hypothetical protein
MTKDKLLETVKEMAAEYGLNPLDLVVTALESYDGLGEKPESVLDLLSYAAQELSFDSELEALVEIHYDLLDKGFGSATEDEI